MSYAETSEQKQLAAQWLQRTLVLAPGHSTAAELYLQKADVEQLKSLFAALAKTQQPSSKLIELCTSVSGLNEAKIEWILNEIKSHDAFRDSSEFFELQLAYGSQRLFRDPEYCARGAGRQ